MLNNDRPPVRWVVEHAEPFQCFDLADPDQAAEARAAIERGDQSVKLIDSRVARRLMVQGGESEVSDTTGPDG